MTKFKIKDVQFKTTPVAKRRAVFDFLMTAVKKRTDQNASLLKKLFDSKTKNTSTTNNDIPKKIIMESTQR